MSNSSIDYKNILQKIDALIRQKDGDLEYSGAAFYRGKANMLRSWLKDGSHGDCPIDVGEFSSEVIVSSKSNTLQNEEVLTQTPEQRALQEQLKEIREHINTGRLRQAVALAGIVESRATGNAKEIASQLLEEARQKRDDAVNVALKKADTLFKKDDKQKAKQHYEFVLELDPNNERAKSAVRQGDSEMSTGKLSQQKIVELRGGLRDFRNIKRLGAALYEAEALDAEEKLSKELSSLLYEARERYDQIRAQMGDETTMMRFGDLSSLKRVRDRIVERVSIGEQYIYDVTVNEIRDATYLLHEIDTLWEQRSADTVQYEMDVINSLLPAHPNGAKVRLEHALGQPFHDHHRELLDRKFEDINRLLELQREAEEFLYRAGSEDDEIRAFAFALKAQQIFSYLPNMEVEVYQARTKAISATVRKMEDTFVQVRGMLGTNESAKVREMINDALKLIDSWPQDKKPEQLQTLTFEGKKLLEFDAKVSAIRKEAEDPRNVDTELKRLEEMRQDMRFADMPELRAFVSEMDQYRDAISQLQEIREARNQGDWRRVFELISRIKDGKNFRNLSAQVEILYVEAEQEVRIEDMRTLLDNLEIKKANSIISQIKVAEKDERRLAILIERLAPESRLIEDAIRNTSQIQALYDRAVALRNGREDERLDALQIFRYLGGIAREKPSPDLPDFVLTLRTDDARKAAVDLAYTLREKCLAPIQKAYGGGNRKNMVADDFQYLARLARILREGNLIHTTEDRLMVRWAEVEWANYQSKLQDGDSAIVIWSKIDELYPDSDEITENLQSARIGKVVGEARRLLVTNMRQHDTDSLINKLEDAIKQYGKTVKLLCVLSEAYAKAGNIENAGRLKREAIRIQAVNDVVDAQEIGKTSERILEEQIVNAYKLLDNNELEAADRIFRLVVSEEKDKDKQKMLMFRFENEFKKIDRLRNMEKGDLLQ